MEPIWSLLKSKRNDSDWNSKLRGGLKSTASGRQWTQTRVKAAGWAEHNKCTACLQTIVESEETGWQRTARIEQLAERGKKTRPIVIATSEQIEKAPIGNLFHGNWKCSHLEPSRVKFASTDDRTRIENGWGTGSVADERALLPPPPRPRARRRRKRPFTGGSSLPMSL